MNHQKYQLVVRRGPQEGQIFPLSGDLLTIGRDPMSDITLSDPEVSRQHARLTLTEEGAYEVQDLGSTNGTFVDGNRLGGEKVRLSPGQVLIVGSNVTLVYESAPDPMATVIAARDELDFGEFSRPVAAEPEPVTMDDEPDVVEVELEPIPEPEPMELPDLEPLMPDAPQWPVMEEAESMAQAATDRLDDMADDMADEPPPYDATIIDEGYRTPDFPSYQPPPPPAREPQPLPSFEAEDPMRTMMDSGRETPPPPPRQQNVPVFEPSATTPPPPPPMDPIKTGGNGGPNRNRNLMIAVVAIILLCCCCALLYVAYTYGDAILEQVSFRPVQQWLAAALA